GISTVVTPMMALPAELVERNATCQPSVPGYIQVSTRRVRTTSPGANVLMSLGALKNGSGSGVGYNGFAPAGAASTPAVNRLNTSTTNFDTAILHQCSAAQLSR